MKHTVALSALLLSLGVVNAELKVTQPTADHWWVAQSLNTLAWDGSSPDQFSVFLSNSDTNVLTSLLALTSVTYAYETSKTINPGGITPATGYTILLTNPLNSSGQYHFSASRNPILKFDELIDMDGIAYYTVADVYAKSETFEIKAVGSAYPPQGSPSAGASASPVVSGSSGASGSASSSAPSATASGSGSGASKREIGVFLGLIGLAGAGLALI
uniref:FAS1 domain-containing protein n=1 Tax=Kwoniella dejecticola CBS 10117 TaxID=1296121 RepID=A0A1A6A4U3_9TREE|nr:uncharacterized protein I303_04408 [Kwoniella dejecticola CBS 10117]OBR85077.1 hypothetical protein I303_04408 [Kwoniella dejecticola CBS 10117]